MKFIRTTLAVMVGVLMAAAAWAGPMVEELHGEAVIRNADLQAQVDAHAADLADLGTQHDEAQASVASLQERLAAAEAALQQANDALVTEQAQGQEAGLDAIQTAVNTMLGAITVPVVELINEHGYEGAAAMIAERLGVDPLAVSALLAPAPAADPDPPDEPEQEVTPADGGEAPAEPAEPVEEPATDTQPAETPAEEGESVDEPSDTGGDSE